ncbi:MAG TPA: chromate efflux transporter [bacterium]|nr:chromate efflux transporter [bacterium]
MKELAGLFLKLGFIAFGGPAAHIAMMREEVVRRRRWMSDQHFLDLLGATNLIPGPNSTEMAIHIGYARGGWPGLLVSGLCFIGPALAIVLALAWVYVRYGTLPEAGAVLYGVKPVIIAIVIQALWGLGWTAIRGPMLAVLGAATLALYLLGVNELVLLAGGALVTTLAVTASRGRPAGLSGLLPFAAAAPAAAAAGAFSLSTLFLTFLKIGAVLYGSGYVLLAFLRGDFVVRLGWLTDRQLLDAVAVGQVTPGPVFTTATFVGYLLGGWGGALLATLGIFLPSFVFVAASHPFIARLRRSPWAAALLDGVNVAALALMAGVTWQLGRAAIVDWLTTAIAVTSAILLFRFRISSVWVIAGGALAGALATLL